METESIAVFGAGGFGMEVAMLIEQINAVRPRWRMVGFFDDGMPKETQVNGWPILGGLEALNGWRTPLAVVFALGMPAVKRAVIGKLRNPRLNFPVLSHPSAIRGAAAHVHIGEGTIICAGAIITTNIAIGRHVIVNLACTIGHQVVIGDFCAFMPSCNISGEVTVGEGSFWGTGAKAINGKRIGAHTKIGAGAVVITDIPDHSTAVGVPARVILPR
jgi:sugar O-acyltransferase (sialic acid O-acetyltransferase NeuD family)